MWFEQIAKQQMSTYDGSHDIDHAYNVAENVKLIMSKDDIHLECALASAWLHDVCDKKYTNTEEALKKIDRYCRRNKIQYFEMLQNVVKHVSYSRLKKYGIPNLYNDDLRIWNIVSQADMLEALGITGMIRTLMYQGSIENNMWNAVDYARDSLLGCTNFITHPHLRKEAEKRKESMIFWMKNLYNETNMPEIVDLTQIFVLYGLHGHSFRNSIDVLKSSTSTCGKKLYSRYLKEVQFRRGINN